MSSGKEEPGILNRQNSSVSAGIPIKKRRFPLFRPTSPPPEEPTPNLVENDSVQDGDASLNKKAGVTVNGKPDAIIDSRTLVKEDTSFQESNIGESSSSLANKESPTDTNVDQDNANISSYNSHELTITTKSGSLNSVDGQEKQKLNENFVGQNIPSSTGLQLAHDRIRMVDAGKINKQDEDRKLELSPIPGNTGLSSGQKHPLFSPLTVNCGMDSQTPNTLLSLSLSEKELSAQSDSVFPKFDNNGSSLCASRSNWDLNTTMDAWEGSVADPMQNAVGFDGFQETSSMHGGRPFINKNGMVGLAIDKGKHISAAVEQECHRPVPHVAPSPPFKSLDALNLSLGTSFCHSNISKEHSGSYAKVDASSVVAKSKLPRATSTGNFNSVGPRIVKLEPFDENVKHNFMGARGNAMGSYDVTTIKQEVIEKDCEEAVNMSTHSPQKSVEQRLVKAEPFQAANLEIHGRTKRALNNSVGKVIQCQDNSSSSIAMPLTPEKSCPFGVPLGSELSVSGDLTNQSENSSCNEKVDINMASCKDASGIVNQVSAAATTSSSVGCEAKELNESDCKKDSCQEANSCSNAPKMCTLSAIDVLPLDSRGNVGATASDDEKINIPTDMLEEDSYCSDLESEGRQYDRQDEEYEDGEVREQAVNMAVEDLPSGDRQMEVVPGESGDKGDISGCLNDGRMTQSQIEEDCKTDDGGETTEDQIKVCVDTIVDDKAVHNVGKNGQGLLVVEEIATGTGDERPTKSTVRKLIYTSQDKDTQQDKEKYVSPDGTTGSSQGAKPATGQAAYQNDALKITESTLPRTEAPIGGNDGAKDANNVGSRSRIINLPRASNVTSPCKTRSIPGRTLPPHTGRERYTDFEGEKLQARGNRDETYTDSRRKFARERIQDHSFGSSRLSYMRGRGDFAFEMFNGPADYRFSRSKRASAIADVDLDFNDFEQDGAVLGAGRGGRKPMNDEMHSFRHRSSRRLSPGSRDVHVARGIQRLHRIPANLSPSRCTGEDGSELGGLRHGEKFIRGLAEDIIDPVFSRSQPYEGFDSQFVRGNRNFTSIPRRGVPRIRSRSPIRSRTRSPGPRTSPRRRSSEGFNGLPGLTRRRSPIFYGMERRSPDHPCFPGEVVTRRRGSPHIVTRPSNELRDLNSGREHDHPRSLIHNRSPTDRILRRSSRRFDNLDPRERTDTEEYFGGPIRSGRFHELSGDGNGDDRRKFVERSGPVRSFRPSYSSVHDDSFRFHLEEGSRSTSFCQENGSDLMERSNLRERNFDRRIKDRPLIAGGRMRGIEEQESNYRHRGQVWHDDMFDDVSRVKRRRF